MRHIRAIGHGLGLLVVLLTALLVAPGMSGAASGSQCSTTAGGYTGSSGPAEAGPAAHFVYSPAQPAAGDVVSFDASSSSDSDGDSIVTYNWTFGDGTTATGAKTTHAYSGAGTYTATLQVVDCRDASGKAVANITVSAKPQSASGQGPANTNPKVVVKGESQTVCRSRRQVRLRLPHGRGVRVLGVSVISGGQTRKRVRGRALNKPRLVLSFFGFVKRPVRVDLRLRVGRRIVTREHLYHPCQ